MTSYYDSGIDIKAGNELAKFIVDKAKKQFNPHVNILSGDDGFAAITTIPGMEPNRALVTSTDGVGSKTKIAALFNDYSGIGIDLVAMVVNDIITTGASPMIFLDYYATNKLTDAESKAIMASILVGCERAHCALVGGETAEVPHVYGVGDFDLAGFCVGYLHLSNQIGSQNVKNSDVIIGIESSGLHSNGYTLVNHLIDHDMITASRQMLTPTHIYVDVITSCYRVSVTGIHAAAHITGGGLQHNIDRVIPDGLTAWINFNGWVIPKIFREVQYAANIGVDELRKVYNCGIGFALIVDPDVVDLTMKEIEHCGFKSHLIGVVKDA